MRASPRDYIEIVLEGGLGNQLFGWAAGVELQHKLNRKLVLNTSHLHKRALALPPEILEGVLTSPNRPFYGVIKKKSLRRLYRVLFRRSKYFERKFEYEKRFEHINSQKQFFGYFQSYLYFQNTVEWIISRLLNYEKFSNRYLMLLSELPEIYISLHLRRGDYLSNSNYHKVLEKDYYDSALKILEMKFRDIPVIVFSDDKEIATGLFPTYRVISNEDLGDPFETLMLISKGVALVGANSSFSLWAGYLMDQESKVTIFPKEWFFPGMNEIDNLTTPQMIRI